MSFYPDATRQEEIDERLILAQQFYNKILEKSIASYRNGKTKVSMAQFNRFVKEIIQEDKRYLKLYSQTRCEIEFRLLKAYQNFFMDARNTSKECSNCGNIQEILLSKRTYICNKCGMQKDRDYNASINILNRATLGQRESHAQGENRQYIPTGNANDYSGNQNNGRNANIVYTNSWTSSYSAH